MSVYIGLHWTLKREAGLALANVDLEARFCSWCIECEIPRSVLYWRFNMTVFKIYVVNHWVENVIWAQHLQHLVTVACCSCSDLSKAKKIKKGRCRHSHGIEALTCKWADFCDCYSWYSVLTYLWGHEVMQVHWKNMNKSLLKATNGSRLQMRSLWRGLYWSDSNWKLNHHGGIKTSGRRGFCYGPLWSLNAVCFRKALVY